ncbi:MAG: hypothetical protein JO078_12585 [Candidatus Eremiobacteraeota bacterium]|nr:hypothetical protein [Candidatus Eremiobacteraeota bacterium]MBV9700938.1 hypothetical protein [Candidatus Eremiobacteraeota bacterium]
MQPPIGASETIPLHPALERVVHSFAGGNDGADPNAAPILIGRDLYGTTALGGNGGCRFVHGCGIAYKVSLLGQERVLHVFTSGTDGEAPTAALTDLGGVLFGTTVYGGGSGCKSGHVKGCGTVFELTPKGKEHVQSRLPGGAKGANPDSQLTFFNGALYGEAAAGGTGKCYYAQTPGCGLIFKITPSGNVSILYAFKGGKDAGTPSGGLLLYNGNFYGTTTAGGSSRCYFSYGCGTVFKMTPSGTETILHRFKGSWNDGALPASGLAMLNGNLYGTTISGGNHNCGLTYYLPCGSVFEVTLSGEERIIYNFQGGADGQSPNGLIAVGDELYGTTASGGRGCAQGPGCGILFKMTPSGEETIVYQFKGAPDASGPDSGLIEVRGTLFGTSGGGGSNGNGTVYAVTP